MEREGLCAPPGVRSHRERASIVGHTSFLVLSRLAGEGSIDMYASVVVFEIILYPKNKDGRRLPSARPQ